MNDTNDFIIRLNHTGYAHGASKINVLKLCQEIKTGVKQRSFNEQRALRVTRTLLVQVIGLFIQTMLLFFCRVDPVNVPPQVV